MTDIKSMTLGELEQEMEKLGEKKFRARQIYSWMHEKLADRFEDMTDLSVALRKKLAENYVLTRLEPVKIQTSRIDGTSKLLFRLSDGNAIESVLMRYHHGNTICVSSEVGCKMGCKFCASTGIEFVRSLSAGEIVEQILAVEQDQGIRISNVVFMGIRRTT